MATLYHVVLVTGANSFVAAAIIDRMTSLGIKVHATVRKETSANLLKSRYGHMIQVFITPNICATNAFAEAIQGCDAVFHVASPFHPNVSNPKREFLDPAIKGTVEVLRAAAATPSIKRVIVTSSIAAILDPTHELGFFRPGYTYTEADWNPLTYEDALQATDFGTIYMASKALAEKAAWEFMNRCHMHFDLIAINPCQIWGVSTQEVSSPQAMNFSNSALSSLMDGKERDIPPCTMPWVTDINTVANAHVAALLKPEAQGRYIIATAPLDFQAVVDIMYKHFPDADWIRNVPRGNPGGKQLKEVFDVDNTKSQRDLDITYPPVESAVIGFCERYQEQRKSF